MKKPVSNFTRLFVLFAFANILLINTPMAQSAGDYRSRQSGNWNDYNTWERYDGANWISISDFPVIEGTASSAKTVTTGTTHTVSLPSGIASGDLLLIFWADANDVNTAPGTPTGWNQLYEDNTNSRYWVAWYKVANGTEGSTLDITAGAERSAHTSYRIAAGTFQGNPVTSSVMNGNSITPNPPNFTSGFGTTNTLWIAAAHSAGDISTISNPLNYTNQLSGDSGIDGDAGARMVTASRDLSASSEDPGTFSGYSANRRWAAYTIAIQPAVPSSTSGAITIQNGHTVTVTAATNADQCTIETTGQVTVNSGITWTIANGTGTDLAVNGTVVNSGTMTMTGTATFNSGGAYEHAQNGGAIPAATWNTASTCEVTGVVGGNVTGLNQAFGNFIWNCTAQANNQNQNLPNTGSMSITGNFELKSTGAGNGDLRLNQTNLTITGDFIQTGGNLRRIANAANSRTITVGGSVSISGGEMEMAQGNANASGVGTLQVAGDFSMAGGSITEDSGDTGNGEGVGHIIFNGTSVQTFSKTGGTISERINFTINNLATVDFGTSVLDGSAGTFTLSSGAKIITSNANGLGAAGSIQNTGAKSFSGNATYEFKGASTGVFNLTPMTTPETMSNLIVNSPSGLSLSMPIAISGTCTFTDGELITDATNLLTINDDASVSGASDASHVNGPVQKIGNDAFTFPTGKSGSYAPIGISAPDGPSIPTDAFTAEYFTGTPISGTLVGIDHISELEYWTLSRSNGTTNNVRVTLSWRNNSAVTDKDFLLVTRFDNMSSSWVNHPATATGDANSGTITTNNALSSFSPFTLGSSLALPANPLPVELLYFNASVTGSSVLLEWSTATESDNDFFVVEKTQDGVVFEEVAKIDGAGTSSFVLKYQTLDESPYPGNSYYRLKQVDLSGHFSYSELAPITFSAGEFTLHVFPNPTYDHAIHITLDAGTADEISLTLVDAMGRTCFANQFSPVDRHTPYLIVLPAHLTPGFYHLIASSGNSIIQHKPLILK